MFLLYRFPWPDRHQVTPRELTDKLVAAAVGRGAEVVIGAVEGLETRPAGQGGLREVGRGPLAVKYDRNDMTVV
jgi:hypothetical protein